VSYPRRNNAWGDARFRGNCDGTLFKELVHHYKPRRIGDPMLGSGTTAHVIDDMRYHKLSSSSYWGSDLRRGFNLVEDEMPGKFDLIWVHPPYWNIIRYQEGDTSDLSAIEDYADFICTLHTCLNKCALALNPGGRPAVLVADVRRRGHLYPLAHDIAWMLLEKCSLCSTLIKAQHNCMSDSRRYASMVEPPIRHESCLVFQRDASEVQ